MFSLLFPRKTTTRTEKKKSTSFFESHRHHWASARLRLRCPPQRRRHQSRRHGSLSVVALTALGPLSQPTAPTTPWPTPTGPLASAAPPGPCHTSSTAPSHSGQRSPRPASCSRRKPTAAWSRRSPRVLARRGSWSWHLGRLVWSAVWIVFGILANENPEKAPKLPRQTNVQLQNVRAYHRPTCNTHEVGLGAGGRVLPTCREAELTNNTHSEHASSW